MGLPNGSILMGSLKSSRVWGIHQKGRKDLPSRKALTKFGRLRFIDPESRKLVFDWLPKNSGSVIEGTPLWI